MGQILLATVVGLFLTNSMNGSVGCDFSHVRQDAMSAGVAIDFQRPEATAFRDLKSAPIRLHWVKGVAQDYIDSVEEKLLVTWELEFNVLGFKAPHPDNLMGGDSRFDVYIVDNLKPGIGGYAGFSGYYEPTPRTDAYGYLVLSNVIPVHVIGFVVSHELFHASQMAYDWFEDIAFMESTATWITDVVFPDDEIYSQFYPYFQKTPAQSLDFVSIMNPYQYGAAMWPMYLQEKFGAAKADIIRAIWEGATQESFENEPDYFDATEAVLSQHQATLTGAFEEFTKWRLYLGDYQRIGLFKEREKWKNIMPRFALDISANTSALKSQNIVGIQPFGVSFIRIRKDFASKKEVAIKVAHGSDSSFKVSAYLMGKAEQREILGWAAFAKANPLQQSIAFDAEYDDLIIAVMNFSTSDYDSDLSTWDGVPYSVEISIK